MEHSVPLRESQVTATVFVRTHREKDGVWLYLTGTTHFQHKLQMAYLKLCFVLNRIDGNNEALCSKLWDSTLMCFTLLQPCCADVFGGYTGLISFLYHLCCAMRTNGNHTFFNGCSSWMHHNLQFSRES